MELHYLRDREGREADFLVTSGRKPWFAVEVKLGETRVDPALVYFKERLRIPWAYQVDPRRRARLRAGRRARGSGEPLPVGPRLTGCHVLEGLRGREPGRSRTIVARDAHESEARRR